MKHRWPLALVSVALLFLAFHHGRRSWGLNDAVIQSSHPNSTESSGLDRDNHVTADSDARPQSPSFSRLDAIVEEITSTMPSKTDMQRLAAFQTHGHPSSLMDSAATLGKLAEMIESTPEYKPRGLEFYKSCALDSRNLTSVRAVCFHHAQSLEIELHSQIWDVAENQVPMDVVELAKSL